MDGSAPLDPDSHPTQTESGLAEKHAAFMSVSDTADFLGVGKGTVDKWSGNGLLEQCKCLLGRRVAFLKDCLCDLLDQGKLDLSKKSNKRTRPSRAEVRKSLVKYTNRLLRDAHFRKRYGERISTKQLVEMMPVTMKTIHEWSSRGLFDHCKKKIGRQISMLLACVMNLIAHDDLDTRSRVPSDEIDPSLPVEVEVV